MGSGSKAIAAGGEALNEILGGKLISVVGRVLDMAEVAEDEIQAAKKQSPRRAKEIQASFRLLRPTDPFERRSPLLYRAHVKELIRRINMREDTRLGTDAEICCVLSETSTLAPLTQTGQVLYEHLFRKLFPEEAKKIEWSMDDAFIAARMQEPMVQEAFSNARKKVYQDWRQ